MEPCSMGMAIQDKKDISNTVEAERQDYYVDRQTTQRSNIYFVLSLYNNSAAFYSVLKARRYSVQFVAQKN